MEQQKIEQRISLMYCRESEKTEVPDAMWDEINRRLENVSGGIRFGKRRLLLLTAVFVLLFGSITCYASIRKAAVKGYGTVESISVRFEDFEGVAEKSGYPGVKAVETTSDGYRYLGVWRSYNQNYDGDGEKWGEIYNTLTLRYRGEGKVATVGVYPAEEFQINPNQVVEVLDWDGVTVYKTMYVHFFLPTDWEEKITEEQRHMLEIGAAGAGVDSEQREIARYDIAGFMWKQGDYCFSVSHEYVFRNMTWEDLEALAREMVDANRFPKVDE